MKLALRRFRAIVGNTGRSWLVRAVLFLALGLPVAWGVESFLESRAEQNWDEYAQDQADSYLKRAALEFSRIQRDARRIAVEIGQDGDVRRSLSGGREDLARAFSRLGQISRRYNIGVELYDSSGILRAWAGRSGVRDSGSVKSALEGKMTSSVIRTPIDAQLSLVAPVRAEGGILGAVLVRRLLETSAPFATRYTAGAGLTETLEQRFGVEVEFAFGEGAQGTKDGRFASATLYGIDSSRAGVVSVMRPARSEYFDRMEAGFHSFNSGLLFLLLVLLALGAWLAIRKLRQAWVECLLVTMLIWGFRYALLALDLPAGLFTWSLFDPTLFASKFGGGLAKSIGDLSLTVLLVALNVSVLVRALLRAGREHRERTVGGSIALSVALGVPLAILLFWSLRGYAAVVRSAVFDSSLEYLNPESILPSLPLALMVVNLLILGIAFLAISGGLTMAVIRTAGGRVAGKPGAAALAALAFMFLLAAILFEFLGGDPLTPFILRLIYGGGVLLLVVAIERTNFTLGGKGLSFAVQLTLFLTAVLLYPLLSDFTHQHDRRSIETLAQDVLRPADTWFSLVVQDGLRSFTREQTVELLGGGDPNDVHRVAYSCWETSLAARQGYTSIFTYFDAEGDVESRFAIGGELGAATEVDTALVLDNVREVSVREIGNGINAVKVYSGLTDIRAASGDLIGFAQVTVAAGQQTLFRGETPALLRSGGAKSLQTFYRPLKIAEFKDGTVQPFAHGIYPAGYVLPGAIQERLSTLQEGTLWVEESIGDENYETGYFRKPEGRNDVLAISFARPGIAGHLIGMVFLLLHVVVIGLLIALGTVVPTWVKARRVTFTFRERLLAGMLATALVPLVVLTWYGGRYTAERLLEESSRTLDDETGTVASYILDQNTEGHQTLGLNQSTVESIASEINVDFNVFVHGALTATSRPELFDLGILDRRLSGSAYSALLLLGKPFEVEREKIGQGEYAIGYRPLVDSLGHVEAIISVPTLFRQERVEEESTQRNAILFGVYVVVLIGVLVLAATLARRIAAPIHSLTDATKRVAGGDLDVRVEVPHADGEVRELIEAFDTMTRELKRGRDDLVRYERELAWKEMAKQVAHEIKNPLTPMKLSIQHLRQAFRDRARNFDEILDSVTRTMIEQIETLSRIASEFSHFARMPRRRIEECDINVVLQESAKLFDQDQNVQFRFALSEGLPGAVADREELRRAFINIIRNGIQAMDGRGRIEIGTVLKDRAIVVTIRDHGKGVSAEMAGKLFEPNFSTKTDGMGLGLAIVKKTVDDLGGTVSLTPAPGGGTVATIIIPLEEGAEVL
jgi:two-component system nitrogen regulation sensor histidine kinase NtrY